MRWLRRLRLLALLVGYSVVQLPCAYAVRARLLISFTLHASKNFTNIYTMAHAKQRGGPGPAEVLGARPENIDGVDFSKYFSAYGYLYNQKEMLEDPDRMKGYFSAIMGNPSAFEGKVVLDVGTGSGILAIWAAKAGAKKVYAVEATYMAEHAKTVAAANGVGDVVEVIQAAMEDVELTEKVDIIVSEWMGYFLLRESMLDSVIVARDKFLKPGGAMYPSHATMYLAPSYDFMMDRRLQEFEQAKVNWLTFQADLKSKYLVSLDCLTQKYSSECEDYFFKTGLWVDTHPSHLLGPAAVMKKFDIHTVTLEDLKAVMHGKLTMNIAKPALKDQSLAVNGIVCWFDVDFKGSAENPAASPVLLTTAPTTEGATHWGQQCFHVVPQINVANGDELHMDWSLNRQRQNERLMEFHVKIQHEDKVAGSAQPDRQFHFRVD